LLRSLKEADGLHPLSLIPLLAFRFLRTSRSFCGGLGLTTTLFSDSRWLFRPDDRLIHILRFGAAPCGIGWIRRKIATGRLVAPELTFLSHLASSGVRFFAGPGLSCPQSWTSRASTGSLLHQEHGRLIGLTRVDGIPTQANEKPHSDSRYRKRVHRDPSAYIQPLVQPTSVYVAGDTRGYPSQNPFVGEPPCSLLR
jgi:hypothetical protein